MGAPLANGGVNPVTGEQAIDTRYCKRVLAVLATAGLYEHSGQWLYDVGLPGKSGVSGGIVTVSPGKGSVGTFSPPLDAAGIPRPHPPLLAGEPAVVRVVLRQIGRRRIHPRPAPVH